MGCNCKGKEKAKKIEMVFKKHSINPPIQNIEKEESGVTLFSILSKLLEVIGKFLLVVIVSVIVIVILLPTMLIMFICNIFLKNKQLTIKLPIYWFKKYKKLADNIEFNVRDK